MKAKTALVCGITLSLLSSNVFAASEDFVISEIMYDPAGSDTDKEWVEVYHASTESATIQGGSLAASLRFFDGSNHTLSAAASQGSMVISPGSYFVLAQNASLFKALYSGFTGTLIEVSAMSLGNTTETLGFRNGSSGSLFSSLSYDKSWGGSGNDSSLEKKVLSGPNDSSNWVSSHVGGGAPGQAYKEPDKITYPDSVKINEFLPDPNSGDEWVELYNSSPDLTAVLVAWQLDDGEGGAAPKTFSAEIPPLGYYVFYFTSSTLNNNGDTVRLMRPDGSVSASFSYTGSKKGFSYALFDGVFTETSSPTPGEKNILAGDPDLFEGSIPDIKRLPIGHKITLAAFVSVPPNLLGDKELYVWGPDGSGIKISYVQALSSNLKVGDKIRVASTIEESHDEKYIKTDFVSLVQPQAVNVEERSVLTGEVSEPYEGWLVRVKGKLEEQSGDTFYINDGSGRAKVYIKDSTGIVKIKMAVGEEIRVTGVVSQYGYLKRGEANYRVLPRFQSDIYNKPFEKDLGGNILGARTVVTELPVTGTKHDFYTIGWILLFLGYSGRLWVCNKCNVKMNP